MNESHEAQKTAVRSNVTVAISRNVVVPILVLNGMFAGAFLVGYLPSLLQTLFVGVVMFLAPGVAWVNQRRGDAPTILFRIVIVSLLISVLAWLVLLPMPGPTSRSAFILLVAALANLGLFFGIRRGWYRADHLREPFNRFICAVAACFFLQTYLGAAYFVPELEDQDMETQGTAYGLIHHSVPTMATNRGNTYFFAHPLLLHFWIGESALLSNDLERLRHYHEGAVSLHATGGPTSAKWKESFERFLADPVLVPTRLPNMFLSAFLIFPLAFLVYRISGSQVAALGACVVYATLPEVYVRSSYGGYMAVTNWLITYGIFFSLQATGAFAASGAASTHRSSVGSGAILRGAAMAAFLGGWADQKVVLLPMAAAAHAGRRMLQDRLQSWRQLWQRCDVVVAAAVGVAFCLGWATFALYGTSVSANDFLRDHVMTHIVDRVRMSNVNVAGLEEGAWVYPSILALWKEFIGHVGWFYAIPLVLAVIHAARRSYDAAGMLLLWFLIGAVGFSLVDWRQTKHLAHVLPALVVLMAIYWASLQGKAKMMLGVLLSAGLVWNVWRVGRLMNDFEYIQPLPIW